MSYIDTELSTQIASIQGKGKLSNNWRLVAFTCPCSRRLNIPIVQQVAHSAIAHPPPPRHTEHTHKHMRSMQTIMCYVYKSKHIEYFASSYLAFRILFRMNGNYIFSKGVCVCGCGACGGSRACRWCHHQSPTLTQYWLHSCLGVFC